MVDAYSKKRKFSDIPDILDPDISSVLSDIARNVFANNNWYIELYIADDGTGDIMMGSTGDIHGSPFADEEIIEAYDGSKYTGQEIIENISTWKKRVVWRWDRNYPLMGIGFEVRGEDDEYAVEDRILHEYDLGDWTDTMIFDNLKQNNKTAEYSSEDGDNIVDYRWESGREMRDDFSPPTEPNEEADHLATDEVSEQFKKVYDIWTNKLRERLIESRDSEVPKPFDNACRTDRDLMEMIVRFDELLIHLEKGQAADAGNLDNYAKEFSQLRESFMHMDRNLIPQSTYRGDGFEENWQLFTKNMNMFNKRIEEHSKRL